MEKVKSYPRPTHTLCTNCDYLGIVGYSLREKIYYGTHFPLYKIKSNVDYQELTKYGFQYTGNWARGNRWEKDVANEVIRKIMIDDDGEIGYGFPYMQIDYPPIENYIGDLIEAGLVEKQIKD